MYSRADRLLHYIALQFPPVIEATFDMERARNRRALDATAVERPVFVTGLARAGTSILTRALHAGGEFGALSYRDMPFPLAPNGWAKLSGRFRRPVAAGERGHGDGLTHDLDSPEAIEEVFWRCFEGGRYIKRHMLEPVPIGDETITAFRDYVRLVLLSAGCRRYLSKNNNAVLRLGAIVRAFPDVLLIHPFRDPVQQALSLRAQHFRAIELAREDKFRRRYMGWLGHFEFGADQRPFAFPGAPEPTGDRSRLDYWLRSWISTYRALLDQDEAIAGHQLFVDYDRLCRGDAGTIDAIGRRARVDVTTLRSGFRPPAPHPPIGTEPGLIEEAMALHEVLRTWASAGVAM